MKYRNRVFCEVPDALCSSTSSINNFRVSFIGELVDNAIRADSTAPVIPSLLLLEIMISTYQQRDQSKQ